MADLEPDPEIVRLNALVISLQARVMELEAALVACAAEGAEAQVRLRDVLNYFGDAPGPLPRRHKGT